MAVAAVGGSTEVTLTSAALVGPPAVQLSGCLPACRLLAAAVATAVIVNHLCDSLLADPLVQVVDHLFLHASF